MSRSSAFAWLMVVLVGCSSCEGRRDGAWGTPPERPVHAEVAPQLAAAPSSTLCVMPVRDGAPTAADIGQAFRMVTEIQMFPGRPEPWIGALNRHGEWTIDASGRYAPYDGLAPASPFAKPTFISEPDGRLVGVRDWRLLAVAPKEAGFREIHRFLQTDDTEPMIALARLTRDDLTLISAASDVQVLDGERLAGWPEAAQMRRAGIGRFVQVFDIPSARATLFEDAQGGLAVRYDGGRWAALGRLLRGRLDWQIEYVRSVEFAARSGVALVSTNERYLALDLSNGLGPAARLTPLGDVDKNPDGRGELIFVAQGAGEIISYRDRAPNTPPLWRRLTPNGFVAVCGSTPRLRRSGAYVLASPVDLPGRPGFAFVSDHGVSIYENGRIRDAVGEAGDVGWYARIVALPGLGRTFVVSDGGLFELDRSDVIRRLAGPFVTGGLPSPSIAESPGMDAALVLAKNGLFAVRRSGRIEKAPGGEQLRPDFGANFLGEIPVSHDQLLRANNALYLVVTKSSPRWTLCRRAAGPPRPE
jgi:hypothetical protein